MTEKQLIKKIARLESINDQLVAELQFLNEITTLKSAAQELLREKQEKEFNGEDSEN